MAELRRVEIRRPLFAPRPTFRAVHPARSRSARLLERFAQPQLQLAGRLLRKRHADNLGDVCTAGFDDPDDAADELCRLACTRRGLDDERVVEGGGDRVREEVSDIVRLSTAD